LGEVGAEERSASTQADIKHRIMTAICSFIQPNIQQNKRNE